MTAIISDVLFRSESKGSGSHLMLMNAFKKAFSVPSSIVFTNNIGYAIFTEGVKKRYKQLKVF